MPKFSLASSRIIELGDDYVIIEEILMRNPKGEYMPLLEDIQTITHRYRAARKPWHTIDEKPQEAN